MGTLALTIIDVLQEVVESNAVVSPPKELQVCMVFCYQNCSDLLGEKNVLKALVVKNSVLHDFGFGKVSRIHETFLMEL